MTPWMKSRIKREVLEFISFVPFLLACIFEYYLIDTKNWTLILHIKSVAIILVTLPVATKMLFRSHAKVWPPKLNEWLDRLTRPN